MMREIDADIQRAVDDASHEWGANDVIGAAQAARLVQQARDEERERCALIAAQMRGRVSHFDARRAVADEIYRLIKPGAFDA